MRPCGASPKLGAFGAQIGPPDRFAGLCSSRLTMKMLEQHNSTIGAITGQLIINPL
jgi:hypothetical protein